MILLTPDPNTGELVPVTEGQYISPEEQARRSRFAEYAHEQELRRLADDERTREFGNFTFCKYQYHEPFFEGISSLHLTRLFYLSTFMLFGQSTLYHPNGRVLQPQQLPDKLGISPQNCNRFLTAMQEQSYLEVQCNAITLNSHYFMRNRIAGNTEVETRAIRIYFNAFHDLYRQLSSREHSKLAYLIRLIPHLHSSSNIICKDPLADDESCIVPLSAKGICGVVGYNPNQSARFMKDLQELCLSNGQPAIWHDADRNAFIIHPALFYSGSTQHAIFQRAGFLDMNDDDENE